MSHLVALGRASHRVAFKALAVICYCKQDIPEGARLIHLEVSVDWGDDDLRDPSAPKDYVFHSFDCVRQWAEDRAGQHDDVTVKEGEA